MNNIGVPSCGNIAYIEHTVYTYNVVVRTLYALYEYLLEVPKQADMYEAAY